MRRIGIVYAVMLGVMGAFCSVGVAEDVPATQEAATQSSATEPATQGDGKWRDLLARLEDSDFKVREGAHEELERVSYEEQGKLKALAGEAKSPEVRAALEKRVEEIAEQVAWDPPPITFMVQNVTLDGLTAALSGATGASVTSWPPGRIGGNRTEWFTLKAEREPFWDVFCKLSAQHGLQMESSEGFSVMISQPGLQRCVHSGGVAVFPFRITREAVSDLQAKVNPASTLTLTCIIAMDPRMKVEAYGGARFLKVVDEKGNVLHAEAEGAPQFWRMGRGVRRANEQAVLSIPDNPGATITSAKGVVYVRVRVAETSVEVAEVEKNWKTPVQVGDRTVTFAAFDAQESRINFSARVTGGGTVVRHVMNRPVQIVQDRRVVTMTLEDSTGKVLAEYPIEGGLGAGIGNTYTPPLKARFSVATKTKDVAVPFELKDLVLPKF